jgi:hypothetical protein
MGSLGFKSAISKKSAALFRNQKFALQNYLSDGCQYQGVGKIKKALGIAGVIAIKLIAPQTDVTPLIRRTLGIKEPIIKTTTYLSNITNDLCRCSHTRAEHSWEGCTAQATVSGGIPGISQIPGVGYALGPGTTCMCRKFVPW